MARSSGAAAEARIEDKFGDEMYAILSGAIRDSRYRNSCKHYLVQGLESLQGLRQELLAGAGSNPERELELAKSAREALNKACAMGGAGEKPVTLIRAALDYGFLRDGNDILLRELPVEQRTGAQKMVQGDMRRAALEGERSALEGDWRRGIAKRVGDVFDTMGQQFANEPELAVMFALFGLGAKAAVQGYVELGDAVGQMLLRYPEAIERGEVEIVPKRLVAEADVVRLPAGTQRLEFPGPEGQELLLLPGREPREQTLLLPEGAVGAWDALRLAARTDPAEYDVVRDAGGERGAAVRDLVDRLGLPDGERGGEERGRGGVGGDLDGALALAEQARDRAAELEAVMQKATDPLPRGARDALLNQASSLFFASRGFSVAAEDAAFATSLEAKSLGNYGLGLEASYVAACARTVQAMASGSLEFESGVQSIGEHARLYAFAAGVREVTETLRDPAERAQLESLAATVLNRTRNLAEPEVMALDGGRLVIGEFERQGRQEDAGVARGYVDALRAVASSRDVAEFSAAVQNLAGRQRLMAAVERVGRGLPEEARAELRVEVANVWDMTRGLSRPVEHVVSMVHARGLRYQEEGRAGEGTLLRDVAVALRDAARSGDLKGGVLHIDEAGLRFVRSRAEARGVEPEEPKRPEHEMPERGGHDRSSGRGHS